MKNQHFVQCNLGDLIYELFEEAKQVSSEPIEQKLLVYAALKDLLSNNNRKLTIKAA